MTTKNRETINNLAFIILLGALTILALPQLSWKNGILLIFLLLGHIFCLINGQKWLKTQRIFVTATLFYLSIKIPPTVTPLRFIPGVNDIFEWFHFGIAVFGVLYLLKLLVNKKNITVNHITHFDISSFLTFIVFFAYSSAVIILGRIMGLPVSLNPRLFMVITTAFVFIISMNNFAFSSIRKQRVKILSSIFFISVIILFQIIAFLSIKHLSRKADSEFNEGKIVKSSLLYHSIINKNYPLNWNDFYLTPLKRLGFIALKEKNFELASDYFKQAVHYKKNDPIALFGLAAATYQSKHFLETKKWLKVLANIPFVIGDVKNIFTPAPELVDMLGVEFMIKNNKSVALSLFQYALFLNKENAKAEFHLGKLLFHNKDFESAHSHLKKAKKLGYVSPELFYQLGKIYADQNKWKKALFMTQRAIRISPTYYNAYKLLEIITKHKKNNKMQQFAKLGQKNLTPEFSLSSMKSENIDFLGYRLKKRNFMQGETISILFYSRLLNIPEKDIEHIYLKLGYGEYVFLKVDFNLLEQMKKSKRQFYPGDVVISKCDLDGRSILPGLVEIAFFFPNSNSLIAKERGKKIKDVDQAKFKSLATISVHPKIYRRVSFSPKKLKHVLDPTLEFRFFNTYFYLSNQYSLKIPLPKRQNSFKTHSLIIISSLVFCTNINQGTVIADCIITDKNDKIWTWHIKAGIDTAEWAWDSPGIRLAHKRAKIATSWEVFLSGRDFNAHKYFSVFDFPKPIEIKSIYVKYVAPYGCIEVCDLIQQGKKKKPVRRKLQIVNKARKTN